MREELIDIITAYADFLSWETIDAIADNIIADGFTSPVRCKDCKQIYATKTCYMCHWWNMCVREDDFCSYGERRNND